MNGYHSKTKKKGVTLIVTMGVLLVLSTTAVTFVRLSSYERASASNYKVSVEAKLAAYAGLDHAIAVLFQQFTENGRLELIDASSPDAPAPPGSGNDDEVTVIYPHLPGQANYDLETAMQSLAQLSLQDPDNILQQGNFSYSGLVGARKGAGVVRGSYEDNGNLYGVKIVNSGGKLNVNSHISTSTPSTEQQDSNRIMNNILQALGKEVGLTDAEALAVAGAIRPVNDQLPDYRSLEEIRQLVESANPGDPVNQAFIDNLTVFSRIDERTAKALQHNINTPPQYIPERRAPIDINNISVELLTALIANINAIPPFLVSRVESIDDVSINDGDNTKNFKENFIEHKIAEELMESIDPRAVAEEILAFSGGVFRSRSDINAAIDSVTTLPLLPPAIEALITGGSLDLSLVTKHLQLWQQAYKDMLKANFNPNVIDNFWIPNLVANLLSTKNDLFTFDGTNKVRSHTTELSPVDNGFFEVTSSARVTAENGALVLGSISVRANVQIFQILEHSSQFDFVTGTPTFTNTMSFPQRHETATADPTLASQAAGSVEPRPSSIGGTPGSTSEIFSTDVTDNILSDTLLSGTNPGIINKFTGNNLFQMVRQDDILNNAINNVVNDGMASLPRYYIDPSNDNAVEPGVIRYYGKTAGDSTRAGIGESPDDFNTPAGNNVGNYKGTIEFWVKMAVDGDAPVESALLAFSLVGNTLEKVISFIDLGLSPFKDGTQTFLIKNTKGELKLTRYYYSGFFDSLGGFFGTVFHKNGDINRRFAKRDISFDIKDWKANSWHHILINWDDTTDDLDDSISMVVDGQTVPSANKHFNGQASGTGEDGDPTFVVLSEQDTVSLANLQLLSNATNRNGMDYFMINGIFRKQKNDQINGDSKFFQHGGVYLGNSTIDMVKSYDGQATRSGISRFPNTCTYRNRFNITLDDEGILGVLRWTAYPSGAGNNKIRITAPGNYQDGTHAYIEISATLNGGTPSHTFPATDIANNGGDGRGLSPDTSTVLRDGDFIEYTATFHSPTAVADKFGSASAILDDIQLMILRPRYLSVEEF